MNIQKLKYKFHSGKKQQTLVLHQGIRPSLYSCLHPDMEGTAFTSQSQETQRL